MTLWASVEPISGKELLLAGAERSEDAYMIRIRYQPMITTSMRAKYAGKVFDITSISDVLSMHRETQVMCKAGVNDG